MNKLFISIVTCLVAITGANAKNLTVYFSVSGNTERLANAIYENAGGDIVRIEPVTPYPVDDYHNKSFTDRAQQEKTDGVRPEIKDMNINLDEYDTIFIGYPIWWGSMPMAVYTFFDKYDLSGKTIAPFNTHEGSGSGDTHGEIARLEPSATVVDGLPVRGGDTTNDLADTVTNWLARIGK
ncbi:MAG: NAD(P)H-dependent oxidoreductase [Alphaproteobacteria bacterium]|nr:NAD(P)H-dependent oxidoreductase [Alphaproteobacteria bacterium]